MPASTHMEIAGVHFTLRSKELALLPDAWERYRPFATSRKGRGAVEVELDVVSGNLPDLSACERLFDGQAWTLLAGDGAYYVALTPQAPDVPPAWVARLDRTFTRGTIFCDDRLVRDHEGARAVVNPLLHRLDQMILMYVLARRGGALFHSAGIALDGRGFVFAGRSGAGKSTLARQFQDRKDLEGLRLLSDDRMVVRKKAGRFLAFGTPWAGDAQIALNESAPLSALFFLHHGSSNRAEPVTPRDALEKLLPVMSIPWYDREMITSLTSFCEALVRRIPAYDLHFTPDAGVTAWLDEFVAQRKHE